MQLSFLVDRIPITYFSTIPPVPEFSSDRILSPLRLREIRKALDNGQIADIELVAQECMQEIVELCSGKELFLKRKSSEGDIYYSKSKNRLYWEYCCSKII